MTLSDPGSILAASMTIRFRTGQDEQNAHPSWYRGDTCHFNPTKRALRGAGGLEEFVLKGWLPPRPFITRDMLVTAFGSCFAARLSQWLMQQQYSTGERLAFLKHGADLNIFDSHVIRFGEGMVNTFALRQQFEWALEQASFAEDLWFGSHGELAGYSDEARAVTSELFMRSDVFIITLGLSEVWCNKQTGDVFWRAIPVERFNPAVHGFRVSSVAENYDNLERIRTIIRKHRPSAAIVITLSPIPLVATFRPVSCLTANSVSKAILRVAVDELLRAHPDDERLFYWPSYEMVKEYAEDPYLDDNRHPRPEIIELIMRTFATHYLVDPYSSQEMDRRITDARTRFARIPELSAGARQQLIERGILDYRELIEVPAPLLEALVGDGDTTARVRDSATRLAAGR